MRALAVALAACAALNAGLSGARPPGGGLAGLGLEAETAVESAALVALGMRRVAADLGLIRLMVYYGTPEEGHEEHAHEGGPHPERPEESWGGGRYAELGPRARRIHALDPSYAYPVLYASGALAFNLDRPEEALELLAHALRGDPRNAKYQAYAAAIGFHRKGDPEGVIRLLEPVLEDPDCPTMIKSMTAFLYRRVGRPRRAAELYRRILEGSRDEGYRRAARRALRELGG